MWFGWCEYAVSVGRCAEGDGGCFGGDFGGFAGPDGFAGFAGPAGLGDLAGLVVLAGVDVLVGVAGPVGVDVAADVVSAEVDGSAVLSYVVYCGVERGVRLGLRPNGHSRFCSDDRPVVIGGVRRNSFPRLDELSDAGGRLLLRWIW